MPGRTAKQCRERYNNHVDPAIKKDKIWTAEEDSLVMKLHAEHHNQFAKIARCIPGRCYDDVKNRYVHESLVSVEFFQEMQCPNCKILNRAGLYLIRQEHYDSFFSTTVVRVCVGSICWSNAGSVPGSITRGHPLPCLPEKLAPVPARRLRDMFLRHIPRLYPPARTLGG